VAIDDGDSVARRRDGDGALLVIVEPFPTWRDTAHDLGRLPLDLLLLSPDEGDDVVEDVHGGDTGVAAAGDGLEGGDEDFVDRSKGVFERFERDDEAGGGAVGVGDDEASGEGRRVGFTLLVNDGEVGGVDGRDDEGNELSSPVVLGVGKDGMLGSAEGDLYTSRE
jgi:hypothetical protein